MGARFNSILRAALLSGRWVMAPFCLGLIIALLLLLAQFGRELAHATLGFAAMDGSGMILAVLRLIDLVLVANLVLMIISAAVEILAPSPSTASEERPEWVGIVDFAGLKPKLFASISAIAAIDLPKCVASSGTPEKIRYGLSCAGLYEQLAPHIFSATQVERGKPAPDLFLFAAEQMKAAPVRCIVIEDSVPGVTGAVAAGMTVLGFFGGSHCTGEHEAMLRAAGATVTFADMRELTGLIERFGQKQASVAGFSAL